MKNLSFTRYLAAGVVGAISFTIGISVQAATVAASGAALDFEPKGMLGTTTETTQVGWRSTNFIGASGYSLFTTSFISLPSYVSGTTQVVQQSFGPDAGYAFIDTPSPTDSAVHPSTSDTMTGTYYMNGAAAGATQSMFSFTLTGTVPSAFRVAILWDNTDGSFSNIQMQLAQTAGTGAGSSGFINLTAGNQQPDFYFFTISGGAAGDTYTLSLHNNGTDASNLQVGGIAFDAVPEPGTYAMIALSLGSLALARRRLIRGQAGSMN